RHAPPPWLPPHTTLFRSRQEPANLARLQLLLRPREAHVRLLADLPGDERHRNENEHGHERHADPRGDVRPSQSRREPRVKRPREDRKSTRLNSSHVKISY